MRFWEDMQNKFGFADGEALPDGVEEYRSIYLRTINKLAAQKGSIVSAVAYNRPGMHNYCLVLFYKTEDLPELEILGYTDIVEPDAHPNIEPVQEIDDAMQEAIQEAFDLELDNYVEVNIEISPDFEDFLLSLNESAENIAAPNSEIKTLKIHPRLEGKLELENLNWFPYCNSAYNEEGQKEIMSRLNLQSRFLAWKCTVAGYIFVATASMNLQYTAPDYQLHKDFSIEIAEKAIIEAAWILRNSPDSQAQNTYLAHLLRSMRSLSEKATSLQIAVPQAFEIGKSALVQAGYWVFSS
jgi:hypothetical protein